ncbi:MAG: polyphosphate kinase 1, partial [Clostridia bacterium]
ANMPEALVRQLTQQLQISEATVCRTQSPIQLDEALQIFVEDTQHAHLRYPPFERKHVFSIDMPIFEQIKQGDIFVHHPYDGFEEVIRFMQTAVQDPKVVSIRQTLYRVSEHSALMIALEEAAHAGKQVVVLLEVKARFDEANNMRWGKRLQRAGCRVLYGIPGLKTHAKITLIIRREVDGLRRYVHLGTGNYHEETACSYTDMGLFTARETFGQDAEIFFRMLCGEQHLPPLQQLICAPTQLRDTLVLHITREIQSARQGKPASIMAKMNALVDPSLIAALYEASQAGVSIRLIVRGICCLRPGVAGISEHITVRSIVGRFLEHSRIFRFENGGNPCLYLSSADWMPRNLDRRIELMFPVLDEKIARKIETVLHLQWMDDCKAWNLQVDGC